MSVTTSDPRAAAHPAARVVWTPSARLAVARPVNDDVLVAATALRGRLPVIAGVGAPNTEAAALLVSAPPMSARRRRGCALMYAP